MRFPRCSPPEVLRGGIYSKIAAPLKGEEWRKVSMLMMMETSFALEEKKKRKLSRKLSERHIPSEKVNDTESGKNQKDESSSIRFAAVRARSQMPSKRSALSRTLDLLRRLVCCHRYARRPQSSKSISPTTILTKFQGPA